MSGGARKGRRYTAVVEVGDVLVSSDILTTCFSCDFAACGGRCCVEGESGAPLAEGEAAYIARDYPAFADLLPAAAREVVDQQGYSVTDADGDTVTPILPGGGACVYAFFEGGSCRCAMERRFEQGRTTLRKPVSCSLYPIRVLPQGGGRLALNLHRWNICRAAFEKGRREGVRVHEFLRGPIVEVFGEAFYSALCKAASALS